MVAWGVPEWGGRCTSFFERLTEAGHMICTCVVTCICIRLCLYVCLHAYALVHVIIYV